MQELDIKRGHWKKVELDAIFQETFGEYRKEEGDEGTWYVASGPALKLFKACLRDKSTALVQIDGDLGAPEGDQVKAIKIKNKVLEDITGFTAKQRAKRAQEAAKKAEA
ncbi:MAG: DUF5611 family protein [Euryarchaeota archaeon]|nr:DUF5611 family protein [Euryarchaeota archaeon]